MTVDSLEDMNSESPQASDSNSFSDDENCESNTNEAAMDTEGISSTFFCKSFFIPLSKLYFHAIHKMSTTSSTASTEMKNGIMRSPLIMQFIAAFNNDKRQTCGRQRHSSRKHMWTLQLTQEMLDHPEPLKLPHCTEVPLRACGNHMTILRRHGPPLQWKVEMLNPAIGGKGVVQPWYNFLEKMDFDDGDEISIYYRYYEKIWDIIIRRQEDWEDDDSD
ncbi:hypothetical protein JHK85_040865 [Glycine max]|nr:hypothetical protein JHK85_040865 [Glycine max]